jgi:hypothetical protein
VGRTIGPSPWETLRREKCSKQGWERSHTNGDVTRRDLMVARRTTVKDFGKHSFSSRRAVTLRQNHLTKFWFLNRRFDDDGLDLLSEKALPWRPRGRQVLEESVVPKGMARRGKDDDG